MKEGIIKGDVKKVNIKEDIKKMERDYPDHWVDTVSLIEQVCTKNKINITIVNMKTGRSVLLDQDTKNQAIGYLCHELNVAKEEGYYSEINFAIIIHQKTGIKYPTNLERVRVAVCIVLEKRVFSMSKDDLIRLSSGLECLKSPAAIYLDFEDMLEVLNISCVNG
jgi:hypothetical protein